MNNAEHELLGVVSAMSRVRTDNRAATRFCQKLRLSVEFGFWIVTAALLVPLATSSVEIASTMQGAMIGLIYSCVGFVFYRASAALHSLAQFHLHRKRALDDLDLLLTCARRCDDDEEPLQALLPMLRDSRSGRVAVKTRINYQRYLGVFYRFIRRSFRILKTVIVYGPWALALLAALAFAVALVRHALFAQAEAPHAAWGVEIDDLGLRAIRCSRDDQGKDVVVADAFDYIEHASASDKVASFDFDSKSFREAIKQFISRNEVKGDTVLVSIPANKTVTAFTKGASEKETLGRLVSDRFPRSDLGAVIADSQPLRVEAEESGSAVRALTAARADDVATLFSSFVEEGIHVDFAQASSFALYNVVSFERLFSDSDDSHYDLVVHIREKHTDVLLCNQKQYWETTIAVGAGHFTTRLSDELSLTYAQADNLKHNTRHAENPKKVFQVMRPVYEQVVSELRDAISEFQEQRPEAEVRKMMAMGIGWKLPGLPQFVAKNLDLEWVRIDAFQRLSGATVVSSPSFTENILEFSVPYGLALQGLDVTPVTSKLAIGGAPLTWHERLRTKLAGVEVTTFDKAFACLFLFSIIVSWRFRKRVASALNPNIRRLASLAHR